MSYFGFEPVSHTTSLTPTTTMPGHPPQLQENQSQPIFPAAGETQGSGTGDCPDSSDLIQELTERLRQLQIENGELKRENSGLKTDLLNQRCTQEGGEDEPNDNAELEERLSEEAARKRLERICKKRADGILSYVCQVFFFLPHGN